ncbi:amino acid permease [Synechococcus sp. PCC 7336]|uniref:amino acid permease n=1 Tax=Synechococcus sp. PCC 7336 TaxID=195250 RepID=UPI000346E686|nr:amino acid permease [Synechococcus sp. PCC 7336]
MAWRIFRGWRQAGTKQSKPHSSDFPEVKRYNTFEGVFKPTLLTILGAIMYLRVGWVVGNAGLLGGMLVVLAAISITLATGLSIASIATNTRLGAGGTYATIAKSLGLEVGAAVGIPLFLSQSLAATLYLIGFREGWLSIFPQHPAILVDFGAFAVVFAVAFISAGLAFRLQYLVLILIIGSLISVFASPVTWDPVVSPQLWGTFPGQVETGFVGTDFWGVFAVFFPAVTGILSGVNLSGELENSRRSIPIGTLSAIGVSAVVYLGLCWWLSRSGTPFQLVRNYTILAERSLWQPAVVAGLLAATFSAALSSFVGAPRILMALGRDRTIPAGRWVASLSRNGEPRRALAISGSIVAISLLLRNLNAIASLITIFFLLTYATVNLVVAIETSLGLMTFRPTLRLPLLVPLYGLFGCTVAMFAIDPLFSLSALVVAIAISLRIATQTPIRRTGEARSGLFEALAQWAATKTMELAVASARAWKPTLLVPVEDKSQLLGEFRLLLDLCQPEGTINLLGLASSATVRDLSPRIGDLSAALQRRGIFTTHSTIEVDTAATGIIAALQTLQSAFFRPNVLFVRGPEDPSNWTETLPVFDEARRLKVGVMLLGLHPVAGLGRAEVISLWIRPQLEPIPLADRLQKGSINLSLLMSLRLQKAWQAQLNLIAAVATKEETKPAREFIEELRDYCRIPARARTIVMVGSFADCLANAPQSDMDFMGLQTTPEYGFVQQAMALTGSSCIFTSDSGIESALA